MRYERSILRILGFVVLLDCIQLALASDALVPQPVATLDIAGLLPNQKDPSLTAVVFSSDTTIEVTACPTVRREKTCPSAVFRWENGVLEPVAQPPKFESESKSSSTDGKRALLDFNDRTVSRRQHLFDDVRVFTSLGMIYPEEVNREVVQVVDSETRRSCFAWHRIFPMTYARSKSAAISPPGEFVAIKVGNTLSVYRLPSVCGGPRVSRRAD